MDKRTVLCLVAGNRFFVVDHDDACVVQFLTESFHKQVFLSDEQWGERGVVVVPAPAFAQTCVVFHRCVSNQTSADGVDAHLQDAFDKGPHVVVVETGIHTAHAVEVASENVALDETRVVERGAELVTSAQLVDGGDGRHELHGRGGAQRLAFTLLVEGGVGRQVVDHQSELRLLQQGLVHKTVEACRHVFRPLQSWRDGVGTDGIGDNDGEGVLCRYFYRQPQNRSDK